MYTFPDYVCAMDMRVSREEERFSCLLPSLKLKTCTSSAFEADLDTHLFIQFSIVRTKTSLTTKYCINLDWKDTLVVKNTEDPRLLPSAHFEWFTTVCNSRGSNAFARVGYLHSHAHSDTQVDMGA